MMDDQDISDDDFAAMLFPEEEDAPEEPKAKKPVIEEEEEEVAEVEEEEETEDEPEEEEPEEEVKPILSDDMLVKVRYTKNGPEEEITLAELKAANIRHADYTRGKQELAEARRQLEEQLTQWAIQKPPEPDWVSLAQQMDPQQFQVYRSQYEAQSRQAGEAEQMIREMHRQQAEEYAAQVKEFNEREAQALIQEYPELAEPEKRTAFYSKISSAAQKYGFTEQELQDIPDRRYVKALRDLAQFLDKQEARPAVDKKIAATSQRLPTSGPPAKVSKQAKLKEVRKKIRASEGNDDQAFAEFLFSGE